MNKDVKNVFTPGSIVSFRSATKISDYHLRVKLYPLETINHKLNCDDNCVIYLLTYMCLGKKYVEKTTD